MNDRVRGPTSVPRIPHRPRTRWRPYWPGILIWTGAFLAACAMGCGIILLIIAAFSRF